MTALLAVAVGHAANTTPHFQIENVGRSANGNRQIGLKTTPDGNVHVVYTGCTDGPCKNDELFYSMKSADGKWATSVVDDDKKQTGWAATLEVDASGTLHVAYSNHYKFPTLRYATKKAGGAWEKQVVGKTAGGYWTSMALRGDEVLVSNTSFPSNDVSKSALQLATLSRGAWSFKELDNSFNAGWFTQLALDKDNLPVITYVSEAYPNGALMLTRQLADGTWKTEKLDDDTVKHSLAIDAKGFIHVAYNRMDEKFMKTRDLMYVTNAPDGEWHRTLVEGGEYSQQDTGHFPCLKIDPKVSWATLILAALLASLLLLAAEARAAAQKEWTFLVFLNGNNNLDTWAFENLLEMEKIGSTDRVNVVVQWASLERKKTVRLLVGKGSSPVLEDLGAVDMGDYRTLVDFVKWGVDKFPAQKYFIDVWDHGTGWHDTKIKIGDISHDEVTGHWITTEQLALALDESAKIIGHKVDLYGSDACQMAMAEIASQVAPSVDVYAGSQIDTPLRGWPYTQLLEKWNALADASPENVARLLLAEYIRSFSGGVHGKKDATFAVYDLSRLAPFEEAMSGLTASLISARRGMRPKVVDARIKAMTITSDYKDLLDFLDQLEAVNAIGAGGIARAAVARVRETAARLVVANGSTGRYPMASGLSIWLPHYVKSFDKYVARYKALSFSKATHWEEGMRPYLDAKPLELEQREPAPDAALSAPLDHYADVQRFLAELARAHPANARLMQIGVSDSGQVIEGLRLGNGPVANLVVATHHGNEYGSTEVAKALAASLAAEPIAGQTVYVIPVLNTQGYDQKKRGEDYDTSSQDPNRDYPGPCGTAGPFKLRSTWSLAHFVAEARIVTAATLHTFHPAVVWPWGFGTREFDPPGLEEFRRLATTATSESRYPVGNSTDLIYPAAGTFEDFAFSEYGVWPLLFELGHTHKPAESDIQELIRVNVPGLRRMLEQAPRERAALHRFTGKCDAPGFDPHLE
ncbi:MAG: succinylglutamate desuccinylase/aspartoacylase family protein [Deltaproteobacteria bacterium]|nr:succinylglutamate desuccinylase/aspartoacylase family protein [Deltaproteobacteria bacterium]